MEEDATSGVVTRLRRRLSVENEEPKSPATPTKKRGGRLAAKPHLENIDELTTVSSPKRSRKSAARDIVDLGNDKPLTPSRRNTRIKSDITQSCHSPRALRAARRNSQTGSDTELPIKAPTRTYGRGRTRKDSSSSIESQGEPVINNKLIITVTTEAIVEESNHQNSNDSAKEHNESVENKNSAVIRRSPRLNAKKDVHYSKEVPCGMCSPEDAKLSQSQNKNDGVPLNSDSSSKAGENQDSILKEEMVSNKNTTLKDFQSVTVSITKMGEKYNKETKKVQSTSLIKNSTKRNKSNNRSKSLSFSKSESDSEKMFFSDNDIYKQNIIINQGLADIIKNRIARDIVATKNDYESVMPCDSPIIHSTIYLDYPDPNTDSLDKITTGNEKSTEAEDQCVPSVVDQSLNKELKEISHHNNNSETDPRLANMSSSIEKSDTSIINNSCEPMEVDEIIPDIVTLNSSMQYNKLNENPTESIQPFESSDINNSVNALSARQLKVDMSSSRIDIDEYKKSRKSDLDISPQLRVDMSSSRIDKTKYDKSLRNSTVSLSADVSIENKENREIPEYTLLSKTPTKHNNTQQLEIHQTSTPFNESNVKTSFDNNSSDQSCNENSLLDDKAEDAGDDYESGDSQDEEEKRYIKENEILEKGETLTSDDEQLSSDSDYKRDSFVVTSDEEDNELISGSGDDLALSDNELNMSTKSKNKYNERKAKEQKLASREMYEARHNLKKNRKHRSKKSAILSDDDTDTHNLNESKIRPIGTNRRRLESASDVTNDNTIITNKKNKITFIDSSDDNSVEEMKMTAVYDESNKLAKDPLSDSTIIVEKTKSPVKQIDATIKDEIEEVHVDENVTMMKNNMTSDPLAETLIDNDTSSSENLEIMQDYDSVLDNLNVLHSVKKIPAKNTSLNLDLKCKQNKNKSIIDQLNLTLTKPSVRKENLLLKNNEIEEEDKHSSSTTEYYHCKDQNNDDDSSDSIDLKLLFPDECSNESEPFVGFASEDFIPLKRTNEKTNLLENIDSPKDNVQGAVSDTQYKRNKKNSNNSTADCFDKTSIVTEKSVNNFAEADEPLKQKSKRHKHKKSTNVLGNVLDSTEDDSVHISENQPKKQKKRNKKRSVTDSINDGTDVHLVDTSKSSQEKSASANVNAIDITENSHDKAVKQPKKRKNKNSKVANAESIHENVSNAKEIVEKSPTHKWGSSSAIENFTETRDENIPCGESEKPKKNKNSKVAAAETIYENIANAKVIVEKSPSHKRGSSSAIENVTETREENIPCDESEKPKKNKNNKVAAAEIIHENIANVKEIVEKSPSHKRGSSSAIENVTETRDKNIPCGESENRKKKKNRKYIAVHNVNDTLIWHDEADNDDAPQAACVSEKRSKKLKRKRSNTESVTDAGDEGDGHVLSQGPGLAAGNQKKRIKLINSSNSNNQKCCMLTLDDDVIKESVVTAPYDGTSGKDREKKKKYTLKQQFMHDRTGTNILNSRHKTENRQHSNIQVKSYSKLIQVNKNEETATVIAPLPMKRSKKRKAKDDDDERKTKSVKLTDNPLNHIQVPRLSTAVIEQLETKPKRRKIDKLHGVIATTSFNVEETKVKKNKPSLYLEESIHVDSKSPEKKKKKPKLLTFAPTASSSASGFTTTFKVNVNPKEADFVAQCTDMSNFKYDHLYNKNIKRQGTYELYKKQRSIKLSKF